MIERREFLEWAHVFDKYYGTPKADTVAKTYDAFLMYSANYDPHTHTPNPPNSA